MPHILDWSPQLSQREDQSAVLRLMYSLDEEGYNANEIQSELQARGLGYRRQAMLADIRQISAQQRYAENALQLRERDVPDAGDMGLRTMFLEDRYAIAMTVGVRNEATGELVTWNYTWHTDRLEAWGVMLAQATAALERDTAKYGSFVDSITVNGLYQNDME